jgi:23S rRNA (cytidine1920-2'-O)/16S rRNA (cytidine1409-2'-O)-methyltransferase
MKRRLDQLLVDRGLAESREKARALILAGEVKVDGRPSPKPGHAVAADCGIEVTARLPYVSRGGAKLASALDHFAVDVSGAVCLDVGVSTGGFTDCLLQRGAARVYAIDTGAGQIDWKLRTDPRVILRENCNARYLKPEDVGEPVRVAVIDVSFISATLILPAVAPLAHEMIVLVKPQFEVGRGEVGKGGVVRDPALHRAACERVREAARALGFYTEVIESPITGGEGNREFLMHCRRGPGLAPALPRGSRTPAPR